MVIYTPYGFKYIYYLGVYGQTLYYIIYFPVLSNSKIFHDNFWSSIFALQKYILDSDVPLGTTYKKKSQYNVHNVKCSCNYGLDIGIPKAEFNITNHH